MAAASEAAAALRADLELLDASTREAASLLDLAAWQLGELDRQGQALTGQTLALATARANIQAARASAEEVLEHLDASRKMQGVIQAGPRAGLDAFLAALERLEAAIEFLQAHRSMQSAEDALRHTAALRDSGLAACLAEFGAALHKHGAVPASLLARLRAEAAEGGGGRRGSVPGAAGAAGGDVSLNLVPEPAASKLRALAGAMLRGGSAGGSGRSCVRAYADARTAVLQGCLSGGLAAFGGSKEELARLGWAQVETKIPGWVAALRLLVRLMQEEARLCAAVFPASGQAAVLSQVATGSGAALLDSADAVLAVKRTPQKMFGLLDMHQAVEAALPPLRAALAAGGGHRSLERTSMGAGAAEQPPFVSQLSQLRGRLAAEVRACFGELQDSLSRDAARGVPADGTVHPVCATAAALLKQVLAYEAALPVLFGDGAGSAASRGSLAEEARLLDRLSAAVSRIFDDLLAVLDAKARAAYRQAALVPLHQMNNMQHVVHALGASRELRAVGEGWLEQHKGQVEAYQRQYMEAAWGPLLALLRLDARQPLPAGLAGDRSARQAVKDKWTAVNKTMGEAQAQQAWAVPDAGLRDAVRDALSSALLPLYTAFWDKYRGTAYTDSHAKYERHSPADVQALLADLFEKADAGSGLVGRSPSRSPGSMSAVQRTLSGSRRLMGGGA